MIITKMFNATEKEIRSKKFNIYIGISLGNKFFTKENLEKYIQWALRNTKNKVLILIVDKIQSINYDVRDKQKPNKKNLEKALKKGEETKKLLQELISDFPKKEQDKIKIIRWGEYEKQDEFYKKFTPLIYKEFDENIKFKESIFKLMKNLIKDRTFSDEDYFYLSKYLIEEFVSLYSGIKLGKDYYGLYIYPNPSSILDFIEGISKQKIFKELNKALPKEKVATLIIN